MKGLVVYHTRYGNCRKIAEIRAKGLEDAGLEVELVSSDARKIADDFDFIAVGSGTRMGRMTGGIKRFIRSGIKKKSWSGKPFLAFGTGVRPEWSESRY